MHYRCSYNAGRVTSVFRIKRLSNFFGSLTGSWKVSRPISSLRRLTTEYVLPPERDVLFQSSLCIDLLTIREYFAYTRSCRLQVKDSLPKVRYISFIKGFRIGVWILNTNQRSWGFLYHVSALKWRLRLNQYCKRMLLPLSCPSPVVHIKCSLHVLDF